MTALEAFLVTMVWSVGFFLMYFPSKQVDEKFFMSMSMA